MNTKMLLLRVSFVLLAVVVCRVSMSPLEANFSKDEHLRVKRFHGELDGELHWPNATVPYWIDMTFYSKSAAAATSSECKSLCFLSH